MIIELNPGVFIFLLLIFSECTATLFRRPESQVVLTHISHHLKDIQYIN
jgi:hypothetical protein